MEVVAVVVPFRGLPGSNDAARLDNVDVIAVLVAVSEGDVGVAGVVVDLRDDRRCIGFTRIVGVYCCRDEDRGLWCRGDIFQCPGPVVELGG